MPADLAALLADGAVIAPALFPLVVLAGRDRVFAIAEVDPPPIDASDPDAAADALIGCPDDYSVCCLRK